MIKNYKIIYIFLIGVPLKGYIASKVIFRFCATNGKKKKSIVGISSD